MSQGILPLDWKVAALIAVRKGAPRKQVESCGPMGLMHPLQVLSETGTRKHVPDEILDSV